MKKDRSYLENIETGNISLIEEVCLPIIPLILLRYESFADFYTEEPCNIHITLEENNEKYIFEQIFRLRIWIPNNITYSWMIYSSSSDSFNKNRKDGIIIRYVAWDRAKDIELLKQNRDRMLLKYPELSAKNVYLDEKSTGTLLNILAEGDEIIKNGICLKKRKIADVLPKWKDIEYRRLFNWGNMQASWSPKMENSKLEKYVFGLDKALSSCLEENINKKIIGKMRLDFIYPPEMFKLLIDGRSEIKNVNK